jgi:hypothetical protein
MLPSSRPPFFIGCNFSRSSQAIVVAAGLSLSVATEFDKMLQNNDSARTLAASTLVCVHTRCIAPNEPPHALIIIPACLHSLACT